MSNLRDDDPEFVFVANKDQTFDGAKLETGQRFSCVVSEAVPLLIDGSASLFRHQHLAPTVLVRSIAFRLSKLDDLGRVWLRPSAIQKIEEKVLPFGTRRIVVEGKTISWMEGAPEALCYVQKKMGVGASFFEDSCSRFNDCLQARLGSSEQTLLGARLPDDEAVKEGLLLKTTTSSDYSGFQFDRPGRRYVYAHVGSTWVTFAHEVESFKNLRSFILIKALSQGRLFAVETAPTGTFMLVAPTHWEKPGKLCPKSGSYSFFLPMTCLKPGCRG